jgi:hypothetical protein
MDSWLQMLLDCHGFAVDQYELGVQPLYMDAYASISSVAFANAEAARLLLLQGLYGTAVGVIRTLTVQNDLVLDLSLSEDTPAKWVRLRSMPLADKSHEAMLLRKYFWDTEVRRRIAGNGETPLSERAYGLLSEAVHGTAWATQLYSYQPLSEPGVCYVEHSPQYHPPRLLLHFNLLLSTLPHLSGYFLQACNGHFRGKDQRFDLLASRYFVLLDAYEIEGPKMRELQRRIQEAEDRVRAGEPFDQVFSWNAAEGKTP